MKKGETYWIQGRNMANERDDGYYFLGWASSPDSTVCITEEKIENISENASFYAVWTQEFYTITLINTFKAGETLTKQVAKGAKLLPSILLDEGEPFTHPEGYPISQPATNTNPSQEDYVGEIVVDSDKTFYTFWAFWITAHEGHDNSDGNEAVIWQLWRYGKENPEIIPSWDNHTFKGWYKESTLTTLVNFSSVSSSDLNEYSEFHVYAKWENDSEVEIEISFPEYSEMDVTCTIEGSRITITAPEGYETYYWVFDNVDKGYFQRSVSVDFSIGEQAQIPHGYYDVYIEATKEDGTVHSYSATIRIQ